MSGSFSMRSMQFLQSTKENGCVCTEHVLCSGRLAIKELLHTRPRLHSAGYFGEVGQV